VSHCSHDSAPIQHSKSFNFLINRLDEEVPLPLAINATITVEDLCLYALCFESDTPAANTILYHLRTKFDLNRLERVTNTLFRKDIDELLYEQVEVCATPPATLLR